MRKLGRPMFETTQNVPNPFESYWLSQAFNMLDVKSAATIDKLKLWMLTLICERGRVKLPSCQYYRWLISINLTKYIQRLQKIIPLFLPNAIPKNRFLGK